MQCETIYKEMEHVKAARDECLENLFKILEKYAQVFAWLPSDFFAESKHLQLLEWLKVFKRGDYESFAEIVLNYSYKYNAKFKVSSLKSTKHQQQQQSNEDTTLVEIKHRALKLELEELEKVVTSLDLRKTSLEQSQSAQDMKSYLKAKHDMVEKNLVELFESPGVLENFDLCIASFLNDALQKWILMENASFSAKEQLCTLKSIDGDWYLEEMASLVLNCNHLSQLIKKAHLKQHQHKSNTLLAQSLDAFDTLSSLFVNLKELLYGYETNLTEHCFKVCVKNVHMLFVLHIMKIFFDASPICEPWFIEFEKNVNLREICIT